MDHSIPHNLTHEQKEFLRELDIILFGKPPMLGETPELEEEAVKWFQKEQERLRIQKEWHDEIQKQMEILEAKGAEEAEQEVNEEIEQD